MTHIWTTTVILCFQIDLSRLWTSGEVLCWDRYAEILHRHFKTSVLSVSQHHFDKYDAGDLKRFCHIEEVSHCLLKTTQKKRNNFWAKVVNRYFPRPVKLVKTAVGFYRTWQSDSQCCLVQIWHNTWPGWTDTDTSSRAPMQWRSRHMQVITGENTVMR